VPGTVSAPEKKFQVGVQFLPVVLGRVATGPAGNDSTYALERTYGFGIWASYRLLAGLSVGLAPQIILPLSAKDSAGYTIIDAEKEYDLLARLAYTQRTFSSLDVYAEVLPGYGFVTYDKITLGVNPPTARGLVLGAGLGAIYSLTDLWFVNAGVGYQMGFQVSHGISDREVRTRFLRIALGGGVRL
jgi:hypothetical protein